MLPWTSEPDTPEEPEQLNRLASVLSHNSDDLGGEGSEDYEPNEGSEDEGSEDEGYLPAVPETPQHVRIQCELDVVVIRQKTVSRNGPALLGSLHAVWQALNAVEMMARGDEVEDPDATEPDSDEDADTTKVEP
ncbi:hypothetical protein B0H14DRAFT_2596198 [Mycena olivaceomarginata]|nr:hypothetical protein B0H14DRAFT_2596198 [Mycena olivaceomarginata]